MQKINEINSSSHYLNFGGKSKPNPVDSRNLGSTFVLTSGPIPLSKDVFYAKGPIHLNSRLSSGIRPVGAANSSRVRHF